MEAALRTAYEVISGKLLKMWNLKQSEVWRELKKLKLI